MITKKTAKKHLLPVLLTAFFILQSGILSRFATPKASAEDIRQELTRLDGILVDVREKEELLETGILEGALWLPLSALQNHPNESILASIPKAKKLFLYCRSGNRSGKAGLILKKMGFSAVNAGGFRDLVQKGFYSKTWRPD